MNWKPKATLVLALVAGAVGLGSVAVLLTNHPKFCASCHTITPSYESWITSSHKDVTCVACHVRPSVEGWIQDKAINGTKDAAIYLFGTPTDSRIRSRQSIQLSAWVATGIPCACQRWRSVICRRRSTRLG